MLLTIKKVHFILFFFIKPYEVIMSTIELNPTESSDFVLTETYENKAESKDLFQKASTPCLREASKAHFFTTQFLLLSPLGLLGAHQFYAGKFSKGIAMVLSTVTIAGLLITVPWCIRNTLELHNECFKDGEGKFILPLPT